MRGEVKTTAAPVTAATAGAKARCKRLEVVPSKNVYISHLPQHRSEGHCPSSECTMDDSRVVVER